MKKNLNRTALIILFVFGLVLFLQTAIRAQGTAFTYQGRLNDNGNPAGGLYDFRFKLYADPLGNVQVGSSYLTNAVYATNGLFTATIDFGPNIFTGGTNWLEVDVRTNGASSYTVLNPLQGVAPTPNAIFATTAGNVSGMVSAAQISGTIGNAVLPVSPNFPGSVTASAGFAGDGANVTNVNANLLNGKAAANFWQTGGNAGTSPTKGNFFGTTDSQSLELRVSGSRGLRLEPGSSGYGTVNVIGGSVGNYIASGKNGATIGGGGATNIPVLGAFTNAVDEEYGTIGGGKGNTIQVGAANATISGGVLNEIQLNNNCAVIGGGAYNLIESNTINSVSIGSSTIGGGYDNIIQPDSAYSTIPGGYANVAAGTYSFAAGQQAQALHQGAFVWADSQGATFSSTASDQFCVRAQGGVQLSTSTSLYFGSLTRQMINLYGTGYGIGVQAGTVYQRTAAGFAWFKGGVHNDTLNNPGTGGSVLMTLTSGGLTVNGTLASTSDRNAKEDFAPVNSQDVLAKVAVMPITKWIYKTDTGTRHIGPMAQDFYAAFAVGPDDKHITTVDEGGVALAAIQGLSQKLEEKETEIKELQARLEKLEQLLVNKPVETK